MSPIQTLFYLRVVELAVLAGVFWWLLHSFPPSALRAKRLTLALVFLMINLLAMIVAIGWAKVQLL